MWFESKSDTEKQFHLIYESLLPIRPIGNYKGFRLLVSIIEEVLKQDNLQYNLSRDIYPNVAKIYNCKDNSIERNLRTLLLNMDMAALGDLTGQNIPDGVTVSKLIDMLVIYVSFRL